MILQGLGYKTLMSSIHVIAIIVLPMMEYIQHIYIKFVPVVCALCVYSCSHHLSHIPHHIMCYGSVFLCHYCRGFFIPINKYLLSLHIVPLVIPTLDETLGIPSGNYIPALVKIK